MPGHSRTVIWFSLHIFKILQGNLIRYAPTVKILSESVKNVFVTDSGLYKIVHGSFSFLNTQSNTMWSKRQQLKIYSSIEFIYNIGTNCSAWVIWILVQTVKHGSLELLFRFSVLEMSSGIGVLGTIKWELVLCLLLAWAVVFVSLSRGKLCTGLLTGLNTSIVPRGNHLAFASIPKRQWILKNSNGISPWDQGSPNPTFWNFHVWIKRWPRNLGKSIKFYTKCRVRTVMTSCPGQSLTSVYFGRSVIQ